MNIFFQCSFVASEILSRPFFFMWYCTSRRCDEISGVMVVHITGIDRETNSGTGKYI